MFLQRNFGRINEDGRLHRVSSGTIKGGGFTSVPKRIYPYSGKIREICPFFSGQSFLKVGFCWDSDSVDECHISCPNALYAIGPSLRPEGKGLQFKLQKIVLICKHV